MCLIGHTYQVKIKERLVEYFYTPSGKSPAKDWLNSIKDKLTQAILYKRIRQASLGAFGDNKPVGQGVFEMRIDFGPGYRIYYGIHKDEVILLLMGGSKRTQQADIDKAKTYWTLWKENNDG
jgi:putative addiction module killer protein